MKGRLKEAAETLREAEIAMVSRDLRNAVSASYLLRKKKALELIIKNRVVVLERKDRYHWAWRSLTFFL